MATWLRKNKNVHVFALFGTLAELAPGKMVTTMESFAPLQQAFWDCSYAMINSLYERRHQLPDSSSPERCHPIDLIFRGMGSVVYAVISQNISQLSSFTYTEDTRREYDTVCRLLLLLNKANTDIQKGDRSQDKYGIASFAKRLHSTLSGNDRLPLSPIIKNIINAMPQPLIGFEQFFGYFRIIDKCHNRFHYGHELGEEPERFIFTFSITRQAVERRERLQLCTGCKVACYCSKECQTQDWKYGTPSHKELCSALARIFWVHNSVRSTHDLPNLYRWNGISDFEVEKLLQHVTDMLYYFSELDDPLDGLSQRQIA